MSASREWLEAYANLSLDDIEGWVDVGALELMLAVSDAQDQLGVDGGVAEIGIYRGMFFIALNGLVRDASIQSLAIDLFDRQHLNIDSSGDGNEADFRANLEKYDRHGGANVVIMAADTTTLTPADVLSNLNMRPRIFSIDGGHTPEHTIADLELARACISPNGVVVLDDILNAHWLGVFEGTVTFLQQKPTLWPLAIGHNKLLLCPMSVHAVYRERLSELMTFRKTVPLCGYDVLAV